jgi:hypothetical protein
VLHSDWILVNNWSGSEEFGMCVLVACSLPLGFHILLQLGK